MWGRVARWLVSRRILLVEYQTDHLVSLWKQTKESQSFVRHFPLSEKASPRQSVFIDISPSPRSQNDTWWIGRSLGSSWAKIILIFACTVYLPELFQKKWTLVQMWGWVNQKWWQPRSSLVCTSVPPIGISSLSSTKSKPVTCSP